MLTLKEIEELEKGLVCLVPKRESVNEFTSLLTSHEYTNNMCDCTKLKLIKMARELLELKEKSETVKIEAPEEVPFETDKAYFRLSSSGYYYIGSSQVFLEEGKSYCLVLENGNLVCKEC